MASRGLAGAARRSGRRHVRLPRLHLGHAPRTGRRHVSCTTRSFPPAEPAGASRAGESFARRAVGGCASGIGPEAIPAASRCSRCGPRARAASPGHSSRGASTSRTPSARAGHSWSNAMRSWWRSATATGSSCSSRFDALRHHERRHALQGHDPRPDEALQGWQREGAPPERRLRARGRHGLRRPRQLRKSRHRDAEPGSLGERGGEVHAVLRRCVGLHAVARDAAHRTLSGPHGVHPRWRLLPLRHDRPRSRRADHRRGAARARLRDGAHRQVAPRPSPSLPSHPSGLRPLLRPALQQRHGRALVPRAGAPGPWLQLPAAGLSSRRPADGGRAHPRDAGHPGDADEAVHRACDRVHARRGGAGPAVLPVLREPPPARATLCVGRFPRPLDAAASMETSSPSSTRASASCCARSVRWASTTRRSSSSPATTDRGSCGRPTGPSRRGARTAGAPARSATARARPSRAACACP